jgi:hypothetical protein
MYSVYLSYALLNHPEYYDLVAARIDELRWAAARIQEVTEPQLHDEEPVGELLQTIILYARQYKVLPDRKGATDYSVEIMSRGKASGFGDLVKSGLERMDTVIEDAKKPPAQEIPADINVLISSTIEIARKFWHMSNGRRFSEIANGDKEIKEQDGSKRKSLPDDAITWMQKQFTRDLSRLSIQPSGELADLKEYVEAEIDRMVSGEDSGRIKTGIDCLDEQVYISKKRRPYIGIMGFANDGKTTLLLTMLYEMAAAGHSVILFSKEHDPTELAIYFAFIHSHDPQYRKRFQLPSLHDFEENRCTKEQGEQLKLIWREMQAHKNFPGRIEILPLADWDSLMNHLKSNHTKNRYEVCAVDYLTRLDIPGGNPRYRDNDIKGYIGAAQRLTRDFDEGRGLIFITPIQINRSGYTAAKKKKEGEKKHDMTSVGNFSEFYWDMDVLISLYSDEQMRLKRQVLLETQKVRKSGVRPCATLGIDPRSEKVVDLNDMGFDTETQKWVDSGSPMSQFVEKTITVGDVEGSIFDTLDVAGGA